MSFDHWWLGLMLSESECARVADAFAAAAAKAILSEPSRAALRAWRDNPIDFEAASIDRNPNLAAPANAFIWAFNLPGFAELTARFVTQDGDFSDLLTEAHVFRFETTARLTPVSIVWHALGYERATLLPGQMGNVLLRPEDVARAQERIQRAFEGTTPSALLAAARNYGGPSLDDEVLKNTLCFLSDGCFEAARRKMGFLALACSQI